MQEFVIRKINSLFEFLCVGVLFLGGIGTVDVFHLFQFFGFFLSLQLFFGLASSVGGELSQLLKISSYVEGLAFFLINFDFFGRFDYVSGGYLSNIGNLNMIFSIIALFKPLMITINVSKPTGKNVRKNHSNDRKHSNSNRAPTNLDNIIHNIDTNGVVGKLKCIHNVPTICSHQQSIDRIGHNIIQVRHSILKPLYFSLEL
jgi:hypothetical protein